MRCIHDIRLRFEWIKDILDYGLVKVRVRIIGCRYLMNESTRIRRCFLYVDDGVSVLKDAQKPTSDVIVQRASST